MSLGEAWKTETIPDEQYKIVGKELDQLRKGNPIEVWKNLVDAIKSTITEDGLNLIEVGCASGYFYEVFNTLMKNKVQYTGADFSEAMVNMARINYPDCEYKQLDIRNIALDDRSYDIVFSSAVLEHVPEWKKGVLELSRICNKYLILSKTPVTSVPFTSHEREIYGGVKVVFNKFNRDEIVDMVLNQGFNLLYEEKTHSHPNNKYKILIFKRENDV